MTRIYVIYSQRWSRVLPPYLRHCSILTICEETRLSLVMLPLRFNWLSFLRCNEVRWRKCSMTGSVEVNLTVSRCQISRLSCYNCILIRKLLHTKVWSPRCTVTSSAREGTASATAPSVTWPQYCPAVLSAQCALLSTHSSTCTAARTTWRQKASNPTDWVKKLKS